MRRVQKSDKPLGIFIPKDEYEGMVERNSAHICPKPFHGHSNVQNWWISSGKIANFESVLNKNA